MHSTENRYSRKLGEYLSKSTSREAMLNVRLLIFMILGIVCLILFFPTKKEILPSWRVQIVDPTGKPATNTLVRQIWRDTSIEFSSNQEDKYTDATGEVLFPKRTARVCLLQRAIVPVYSILSHESFYLGPNGLIYTQREDCEGSFMFTASSIKPEIESKTGDSLVKVIKLECGQ